MIRRVNLFLILYIAVACYSCQQDITKQNQEWIIGDWEPCFDGYVPFNLVGYQFDKSYGCVNKTGFYSYFCPDGLRLDISAEVYNDSTWFCDYPYPPQDSFNRLYNVNHAYGNKTVYSLEKDTLQIYDLARQKWMKYHLSFKGRDTMQLTYWHDAIKCNITDRLIRKSYPKIAETPTFDQFIFYSAGFCCIGAKFLLIRRDGLFFSYGYYRTDDFFIAHIQPEEFMRIENQFKRANIQEIIDSFHISVSNRKQYSWYDPAVSFISSDQKMYTIREPLIRGLPNEFEWSCLSGIFLPDVVQELRPTFEDEYPSFLTEINDFSRIHISGIPYYVSERFYLGVLLCYAEEVEDIVFEPEYDLIVIPEQKVFMKTDGRYFRYKKKDGKEVTLDIGFNFIEMNGLEG